MIFALIPTPACRLWWKPQESIDKLVAIAETGQDSRHYITNGVHGVIYRNVSGEALVQCVRKVSKGETWCRTRRKQRDRENDLLERGCATDLRPKNSRLLP